MLGSAPVYPFRNQEQINIYITDKYIIFITLKRWRSGNLI